MTWNDALKEEYSKSYYQQLKQFVNEQYEHYTIYPPKQKVFNAFALTPLDRVKVVIIGQDPYHGKGQAMGLSFSVPKGITIPPSLANIYEELRLEYPSFAKPSHGDLTTWASQGVLLLNTSLTVREHEPNSHSGHGWEIFTDAVIKAVEMQDRPIVYMLWGAYAKSKRRLVTNPKHFILEAAHPSPFSAYRGFFGCNHFIKCNEYLMENSVNPIVWTSVMQ